MKMLKTRKSKQIFYGVLWLLCFLMVTWPIGTMAQRFEPYILGMPFCLFYFWAVYSLLILVGVLVAWRLFRD